MVQNNEVSIQEQLRDAEVAEEPGNIKAGSVVGNSNGMTMSASELNSAGWVYVYDTFTGDRSIVNRNMLPQQLQKRRENGSYVFTTTKPEKEKLHGTIKCLLHETDPNRELYDSWGLAYCTKDNLTASHDLRVHMEKRHRREWATIDGENRAKEKEEEKAKDNLLAEAIKELAASNRASNNRRTNNGEK
jgi:hypothetical protein|tara:strand:- start:4 stop:570 length:567 start_codon:yes stop_codon:yes gene_type:complete